MTTISGISTSQPYQPLSSSQTANQANKVHGGHHHGGGGHKGAKVSATDSSSATTQTAADQSVTDDILSATGLDTTV